MKLSNTVFFPIISVALSLIVTASCNDQPVEQAVLPVEVPVIEVKKTDVEIPIEFVGQTRGAVDVEVRARVEGILQGVHFQEGKEVSEGDLLYTIDPAPYEAKVSEAQAKLSEAEVKLIKAQSDLKRIKPLAEIKAVSERDLDSAVALEGVAARSVEAAKAALSSAKIELSYATIHAPISGIISLSKAKVGEFVSKMPNQALLASISQLDPIHVRFNVSENQYLYFAKLKQAQGGQNEPRKIYLELSDKTIHPHTGRVISVDSQIDPSTGSIAVEASFPNPGKLIRTGQYAKISSIAEVLKSVIMIPQKSIRDIQGVKQLAVINKNNEVEIRTVITGKELNSTVRVVEGLSEGEFIVPEFQQRLKNGSVVVPALKQGA